MTKKTALFVAVIALIMVFFAMPAYADIDNGTDITDITDVTDVTTTAAVEHKVEFIWTDGNTVMGTLYVEDGGYLDLDAVPAVNASGTKIVRSWLRAESGNPFNLGTAITQDYRLMPWVVEDYVVHKVEFIWTDGNTVMGTLYVENGAYLDLAAVPAVDASKTKIVKSWLRAESGNPFDLEAAITQSYRLMPWIIEDYVQAPVAGLMHKVEFIWTDGHTVMGTLQVDDGGYINSALVPTINADRTKVVKSWLRAESGTPFNLGDRIHQDYRLMPWVVEDYVDVLYLNLDIHGNYTTRGNAPIPAFGDATAIKKYWNQRHYYEQYEELGQYLQENYPEYIKVYPIGHTWQERTIWCWEISDGSGSNKSKTPLAVIGPIHGGEQEGTECTAYVAWWLVTGAAANDSSAKDALNGYVYYVIPEMNVDGYVHSMFANTRQNLRPRGLARDPYFDRTGNGKAGNMFVGGTATTPPATTSSATITGTSAWSGHIDNGGNFLGVEAYDLDGTGRFGDSLAPSAIDMNRSFDYFWTLYQPAGSTDYIRDHYPDWEPTLDITNNASLGANGTWGTDPTTRSAGPGPSSEPEVQAIQNFFTFNPPQAMSVAHTGMPAVLYPWCYTYERAKDYEQMRDTSAKMADAFTATVRTVRNAATTGSDPQYFSEQSHYDYSTSAEMIDWFYGRLGTRSYTVEVYSSGNYTCRSQGKTYTGWGQNVIDNTGTRVNYWNTYFPAKWVYLGAVRDGRGRAYDDVWINYTTTQIRAGEAPPDQYIMCEGYKDCVLEMAYSEARFNPHPGAPDWMKWSIQMQPGW